MAEIILDIEKYRQEGDLDDTYAPLKNLVDKDNSICDFNTDELSIDLNNPLSIECQPSYDGTVNLIINDDKNPPRIVNTRFTKIEDGRYRIINRNQKQQTNLYKQGMVDRQTRLFRNLNNIPRFELVNVSEFGQMKGGNYTFYVKLADNDYNKTDVVAESGQISIFHGNYTKISSVSGTLQDERTNKSVVLNLANIDTSFSSAYVYYTREYSDTNGFRMSETVALTKPYPIKENYLLITITGYEEEQLIDSSELNIKYHYVNNVKTQAQVQNMLFFGNVETDVVNTKDLQNLSYFIDVTLTQKQESIGWIDNRYNGNGSDNLTQSEYYNPMNIYYNVGYWPDEIYRIGVVYIMNDDSLSPVFNLRGCSFENINDSNMYSQTELYDGEKNMNYLSKDEFIADGRYLDNTMGVFKNPSLLIDNAIQDHKNKTTKPWFYRMRISEDVRKELISRNVKGMFFVRQKRIPTVLGQGLSIGIDSTSYVPTLYDSNAKDANGKTGVYITEGFLNKDRLLSSDFNQRILKSSTKQSSGLLCMDACVSPVLQSMLDGSDYILQKVQQKGSLENVSDRHYGIDFSSSTIPEGHSYKAQAIFVNSDVPAKVVNDLCFSTRAGAEEDIKSFGFFGGRNYSEDSNMFVRGIYCPFVGTDLSLEDNSIYNIRIKGYNTSYLREYFKIRGNDLSAFYAISDRYELENVPENWDVYRGDCYTNTVTFRLNRNFVDSSVPVNDLIIDTKTWKNHYKGFLNTPADEWLKMNKADINTVPMGMWVTFKNLSSYNLGLRSFDRSYVDEQALLGNPRGFYPITGISTKSPQKIEESWILNDGYNATVGQKVHVTAPDVPYTKDQFDNRIMFSNVQVDDDFKNAYRIFQGLSYKDIDRQYGAIVKMIPWSDSGEANILCVFEHGVGIVPVNQQALMSTTTGQSIHLYGAGVLQSRVSVITPDFGSIWSESIIRTPIGVYGVDTYAKKIWRYSHSNGFETISDMKVQRFLNDKIKLMEEDKYPTIGLRNVKSHYNNYKGDVMFTFYNFTEGEEWHLCFNERMNKWITRYSWTPLCSENINNSFYSMDKKRTEILSYIYDNRNTSYGIRTSENEWKMIGNNLSETFNTELTFVGSEIFDDIVVKRVNEKPILTISSSYIDKKTGEEVGFEINPDIVSLDDSETGKIKLSWNRSDLEFKYNTRYPLYYKINLDIIPKINGNDASTIKQTICVVADEKIDPEKYNDLLGNGFYVHGRAGIFNEIDYFDENPDNQIKPTKWYNKQEPFEFEFVVNEPVGLHKIFDNLVIISNKVEPKSIEFEIIGDAYNFKKSGLFKTQTGFKNTTVDYDPILNQYTLITEQECRNIEKPEYGRRLGNIHYKEDSWYLTIEPIKFDPTFKAEKDSRDVKWQSTRIRDKFAKIRVKYSGEDLVVITAIKNLYSLSSS